MFGTTDEFTVYDSHPRADYLGGSFSKLAYKTAKKSVDPSVRLLADTLGVVQDLRGDVYATEEQSRVPINPKNFKVIKHGRFATNTIGQNMLGGVSALYEPVLETLAAEKDAPRYLVNEASGLTSAQMYGLLDGVPKEELINLVPLRTAKRAAALRLDEIQDVQVDLRFDPTGKQYPFMLNEFGQIVPNRPFIPSTPPLVRQVYNNADNLRVPHESRHVCPAVAIPGLVELALDMGPDVLLKLSEKRPRLNIPRSVYQYIFKVEH